MFRMHTMITIVPNIGPRECARIEWFEVSCELLWQVSQSIFYGGVSLVEVSLVTSGGGDSRVVGREIRGNVSGVPSNSTQPPLSPISTIRSSIRVSSSFLNIRQN